MMKFKKGFTMIELLIVITILGVLAVAVLSAINPIEQINRGRDTGGRSDAEQLLGGIDRFYASQGYYPWMTSPSASQAQLWTNTKNTWTDGTANTVLNNLSTVTGELKSSFINRIQQTGYNSLYVYNNGTQGDSTYICFHPQSNSFAKEAFTRCRDVGGVGLPADINTTVKGYICPAGGQVNAYSCLP